MLKTTAQYILNLCKAIEAGYASGKSGLDDGMVDHLIELGDQAEHIGKLCQQVLDDAPATLAEISQARETYGSNELEVDDNALASRTDDGAWIQAWVWVDYPKD